MSYGYVDMPAQLVTTTVISAAASQRIQLDARAVRFSVDTKGLWVKFGDSTVASTAGTAGEFYVPAGMVVDVTAPNTATHVAIIQAGATAAGSVSTFN
jgi:hypothetical protein